MVSCSLKLLNFVNNNNNDGSNGNGRLAQSLSLIIREKKEKQSYILFNGFCLQFYKVYTIV